MADRQRNEAGSCLLRQFFRTERRHFLSLFLFFFLFFFGSNIHVHVKYFHISSQQNGAENECFLNAKKNHRAVEYGYLRAATTKERSFAAFLSFFLSFVHQMYRVSWITIVQWVSASVAHCIDQYLHGMCPRRCCTFLLLVDRTSKLQRAHATNTMDNSNINQCN